MYDIKNADGSISQQKPIDGAWYCHFIIKSDNHHVDGNIAQCHYVDEHHVEFLDDDGYPVDMFSDDFPCYLILQA
jgi:hypothetical protein